MIFPQFSPTYLDEPHRDVLKRMESAYAQDITVNLSFWGEADTDTRFMINDQTLWNDIYGGNLPATRRRQYQFNRIAPIVNMISGYQRRNRKSTIVTPIENGDSETADQFTKIMFWLNQKEDILETISESFYGSLITGMNLLHVWLDYRSDPVSGNIRVDNCSYNSWLIDPFFRKSDLSDCNHVWKRSFLTKRECISLMPDQTDEILSLYGTDSGTGRDGKFQFLPESFGYAYKNLLTYDEFYYRDYRKQKALCDTQTGEVLEWKSNDDDKLREFLQTYPQVTMIEQEIPTVKLAIVIQGKVFYNGAQPSGLDDYPFVPVFAYYHPESPYFNFRIQGVVRGLRDAQYLYNRRKVIELDILESQVNSGWIYKENALINPNDVFTLTGQGKGIALKRDAQMTDVQQIQAPQIPPSMLQLSEILSKELYAISGANEELMGSAVDEKAGILSMLRQGAGLTTLQILFDNLDRAQKQLGRRIIDLIQLNFTPGKVKRILGDEPTAQFYNKAFGRYDAAVEEGFNTTTQKQMEFAQLLQLREVGVQIPDDVLLEAATLQKKKQLVETVQQNQQQQAQMQQQQQQIQMQELQSRANLAEARAEADRGLGVERLSRVEENRALAIERMAQSKKDEEIGLLNLIKAMKELESLDISHIKELINLAQSVKAQEAVATQKEVAKESTPTQNVSV